MLPTNLIATRMKLMILQWESQGQEELHLVDSIELNTKHYVDVLSKAVDKIMPQPSTDVR